MAKKENDRYTLHNVYSHPTASILQFHSGNSKFTSARYHLVGLSIIAANFQSYLSYLNTKDSINIHILAHTYLRATFDKHKSEYL